MKQTTLDHHGILEMALVGLELQRNRIEAAVAEIQAELGHSGAAGPSTAKATSEQPTPRKKRFSAAARKRMAAAQKKRWAALKTTAKRTQPTAPAKRQRATGAVPAKKRPVPVKTAKRVVPKPKAKRAQVVAATPKPKTTAPKIKKIASNPSTTIEAPSLPVQPVTESTPATA